MGDALGLGRAAFGAGVGHDAVGKAGGRAGNGAAVPGVGRVDIFALLDDLAANGAYLVPCVAADGAAGFLLVLKLDLVVGLVNGDGLGLAADGAGVAHLALGLACSALRDLADTPAVILRLFDGAGPDGDAADGADLVAGVAVLGAGRGLLISQLKRVIRHGDGLHLDLAALGAGMYELAFADAACLMDHQTLAPAVAGGFGLGALGYQRTAVDADLIAAVAAVGAARLTVSAGLDDVVGHRERLNAQRAADGAGIGDLALVHAGRFESHAAGIPYMLMLRYLLADGGHDLLHLENDAAAAAVAALGKAAALLRRLDGGVDDLKMAERGHRLLRCEDLAAAAAVVAVAQAGHGAGRGASRLDDRIMAERGSLDLSDAVAVLAHLTLAARLRAGAFGLAYGLPVMSVAGDLAQIGLKADVGRGDDIVLAGFLDRKGVGHGLGIGGDRGDAEGIIYLIAFLVVYLDVVDALLSFSAGYGAADIGGAAGIKLRKEVIGARGDVALVADPVDAYVHAHDLVRVSLDEPQRLNLARCGDVDMLGLLRIGGCVVVALRVGEVALDVILAVRHVEEPDDLLAGVLLGELDIAAVGREAVHHYHRLAVGADTRAVDGVAEDIHVAHVHAAVVNQRLEHNAGLLVVNGLVGDIGSEGRLIAMNQNDFLAGIGGAGEVAQAGAHVGAFGVAGSHAEGDADGDIGLAERILLLIRELAERVEAEVVVREVEDAVVDQAAVKHVVLLEHTAVQTAELRHLGLDDGEAIGVIHDVAYHLFEIQRLYSCVIAKLGEDGRVQVEPVGVCKGIPHLKAVLRSAGVEMEGILPVGTCGNGTEHAEDHNERQQYRNSLLQVELPLVGIYVKPLM